MGAADSDPLVLESEVLSCLPFPALIANRSGVVLCDNEPYRTGLSEDTKTALTQHLRLQEQRTLEPLPKISLQDWRVQLRQFRNALVLVVLTPVDPAFGMHKLAMLGALAGGVAHDINNLLAALSGTCTLLFQKLTPEQQKQFSVSADTIDKCIDRSGQLNRLLTTAILGSAFSLTPLPTGPLLDVALDLFQRVTSRRVSAYASTDPGTPPILGDQQQILAALLSIAIEVRKTLQSGYGKVAFHAASTGTNRRQVSVRISAESAANGNAPAHPIDFSFELARYVAAQHGGVVTLHSDRSLCELILPAAG